MAPLEMLLPSSAAVASNRSVATGGKRPKVVIKVHAVSWMALPT